MMYHVFIVWRALVLDMLKLVQIGTKTVPAQEEPGSTVPMYVVPEAKTVVLGTQESGTTANRYHWRHLLRYRRRSWPV